MRHETLLLCCSTSVGGARSTHEERHTLKLGNRVSQQELGQFAANGFNEAETPQEPATPTADQNSGQAQADPQVHESHGVWRAELSGP